MLYSFAPALSLRQIGNNLSHELNYTAVAAVHDAMPGTLSVHILYTAHLLVLLTEYCTAQAAVVLYVRTFMLHITAVQHASLLVCSDD